MIIESAPHVNTHYLEYGRLWLEGRTEVAPRRFGGRRTETHLSDLQLCPLKPYYVRTVEELPRMSDDSVLRILRGRATEGIIASELDPVTVDGIIGTVDDIFPEDGGLVEIKTTNESVDLFDLSTSHPDWRQRMMGYCHMYKRLWSYLWVYFTSGNLLSYMYWASEQMKKKYGDNWRKKIKYQSVASAGYKVIFTQDEISSNWREMLIRKQVLEDCVASKTPMPIELVREQRPSWQCNFCEFADGICYTKRKQ